MLIIAKALEAYFVDGIQPEVFVKNHSNMDDFFIRTKFNRTSKLFQENTEGERMQLQNITRYYVSIAGYRFIKTMPPLEDDTDDRVFEVESGYLCTEMNHKTDDDLVLMKQTLDYQYYLDKINDNISKIEDEWIDPKDVSFTLIDDTQ